MNKIIGGSHHEHAELQRDTVRKDTVVDVINSTTGDRNFDREFLARNLHDNLGGLLSMVKLNLKNIKSFSAMDEPDIVCFNTAMDILNKSIDELRNMTHHTMPDSLMVYGLKTAIESFCSTVPTAHFRYDIEAYSRDSKVEMIIYQCFYELMNNAMKHASAQNIDVLLKVNDASVSLTVCDDGIGFDMETDAYGAGFENIRNRLTACNGKLNIRSTPGAGSEIDIEIKLIN
jgi:signal transduction histidine kinase